MQRDIERLRHKLRKGRSELFHRVIWSAPSHDLLEAHASLIDEIIEEIYQISCQAADSAASPSHHSGLAIVATGGYGRRDLSPFSDIDIAFVPSEEADPWVEALVHSAFKLVMDVFLSLRETHVGYSFRPIAEANAWDVSTKTSLLDLRHICGDRRLANELKTRIREVLSPLDIMLETSAADDLPSRKGRCLYSVEPNLKEGPGSLRDLHRARWILKLFLRVDDNLLESALRKRAGFSGEKLAEIREAADWFLRARTWLHLVAGKRSDVLMTNYQDRIAHELNNCGAQEWMARHLMHSETLARFRESAVRALRQGPLQVSGVRLEGGTLHLQEDVSALNSPVFMFFLSQRYEIPLNLSDLGQLDDCRSRALEIHIPSGEEAWTFNQILNESRGVAATLRALCEFGILDRFIPDFSKAMRYVPPDPAHRHTVGEHSFRMVEHLERLRRGLDANGQRFTDLLQQCPHFDMLCLAALLHDVGKLVPSRDHCEAGAELAREVSARLNLAPEKSEILEVLIRQHLLLVRTARLHDLKSTNVIQKVAGQVPDINCLRHLYVFTYVDTCAVADKNWTSMDDRDLEDLYRKMQETYALNVSESVDSGEQKDRIILVRKKLAALQASEHQTAVLRHCDAMPASYVLNTPLEEIVSHLQLLERLDTEKVVLDVFNRPGDDYSELTVCTYDDPQPGMLAKITGVLYGCDVDIHRAQAFTIEKTEPVILDTLWIRANGMQISENRARKIRAALKGVLMGVKSIDQFLAQVRKDPPGGIVADSIDLSNDLSEEHTVVHIVARDLQGLLYLMTRSLSRCGLHIHSAKIATWNARAENNFYVTVAKGGQIRDKDLKLWKDRLARVLQGTGNKPLIH